MSVTLEERLRPRHIPIYYPYKRIKWDQFAVGFFGALAIFGVLMKLWQPPFWGLLSVETGALLFEIFMPIGFLGECIVFIIMGFVKGDDYEEVYPSSEDLHFVQRETQPTFSGIEVNLELSDAIRDIVERKMDKQLDEKVREIVNIIASQASSTIKLNQEVNLVQENLLKMSQNVFQFSEKMSDLQNNVAGLSELKQINLADKVEVLNQNIANASASILELEEQIKRAAAKFENFNR
jgi:hypothetical protein